MKTNLKKSFFLFLVNNKEIMLKKDYESLIANFEKLSINFNDDHSELELKFTEFTQLHDSIFNICLYDDNIYTINNDDFIDKLKYEYWRIIMLELPYKEQLKCDEWKKKRLEIIKKRSGKCERCLSNITLQIHHKKYLNNKLPWEYEDDFLECLCRKCHEIEHNITSEKIEIEKNVDEFCLSNDDSKILLSNKIKILKTLNNDNVNYIVNRCEVKKFTKHSIAFEFKDYKIKGLLKKIFPNVIYINAENNICFSIIELNKYLKTVKK